MVRLILTIEEASLLLGVGRSTAYEQARSGAIAGVEIIQVGRRKMVPAGPLADLLGVDVETLFSGRRARRDDASE